ncbi:MAG TPA: ABC transporter ATP-binding protein [Ktedonobacterales bacterium]|nr:ABC transporter ATP-binding protein [Ktedonobacterales bacterium]
MVTHTEKDTSQSTAAVSTAALELRGVTAGYGGEPVLRALDLAVAPGEMVALLGPNGAGKSTLLKVASGVLALRGGAVTLAGVSLARLRRGEVARRVAVVPQEFAVQFAYTVRQIVALGRMPHGGLLGLSASVQADEQAVERALAETRIAGLAEAIFNELSGGERQRVMLALALAQSAPLLLLDEPTAHLDIRHQIEALELLRRLNRERGLTVLAAMHDLNLAARYFPRLVLLDRRIVADGPPAAVLDAGLLARVYQTPVRVGILPGEAHLSVLPPPMAAEGTVPQAGDTRGGMAPTMSDEQPRVHVIAGGGSGALLMRALADAGIAFTAGPLNAGDSDHALAVRLAATVLVEPPYAPISPEGLTAARARMDAATTLICPAPLGPGSIALIEAALDAQRAGRRVLLFEPELALDAATPERHATLLAAVTARDYSGRGADLYAALLDAGAAVAVSVAQAVYQ